MSGTLEIFRNEDREDTLDLLEASIECTSAFSQHLFYSINHKCSHIFSHILYILRADGKIASALIVSQVLVYNIVRIQYNLGRSNVYHIIYFSIILYYNGIYSDVKDDSDYVGELRNTCHSQWRSYLRAK